MIGDGLAADLERTRHAGTDRHLTRPADVDRLRKEIEELPTPEG